MFYIETCTFSQSHTVLIEYYSKWVNSNSSLYLLAIWLISSCRAQFFFHKLSSFFTVEQWYFDSFNRLLDGRDRWRAPAHTWAHFKQTHTQTYSYSFTIWLIYDFFLVINIDKIWFIYYILSTECFEKYWGRSASC